MLFQNLGYNICRLLHVLVQFLFTTSETELYCYHQKVNVRVALQIAEAKDFRCKTSNLRKLRIQEKS